jgi:hypothetical protein
MLVSKVGTTARHLDGPVAHQPVYCTEVNSSRSEPTGEGMRIALLDCTFGLAMYLTIVTGNMISCRESKIH